MSFTLHRKMSLGALRSFVVRVVAALGAAGFTELVAPWRALRERVRAEETDFTADEEHEAETTAQVRVCDEGWDRAVVAISSEAHHLSGGKADQDPYAALFGTIKAKDLLSLGPAKATVAAQALLSTLDGLAEPKLATFAEDLRAKTEALKLAEAADMEAELKLAKHALDRTRLLRQTETLIAETEAKILAARPGSSELVRAILNPNAARRPARKQEPAETPEAPEWEETP